MNGPLERGGSWSSLAQRASYRPYCASLSPGFRGRGEDTAHLWGVASSHSWTLALVFGTVNKVVKTQRGSALLVPGSLRAVHLSLCVQLFADCSPLGSSVHGDSPGKNTGAGCHSLFQEIFPTQKLNRHFLPVSPALAGRFFTT